MNIFGHAWVAAGTEADARFVLGAMLPDIEQMVGGRILVAEDEAVARGIAMHHRTDAVFHELEEFRALNGEGRKWLAEAGLRRGPALAAAHVGIEMLIDGFIPTESVLELFEEALQLSVGLQWRTPEHGPRFEYVRTRLAAADIPAAYRDPDEVGRRLARIFSHRPRLRLRDDEHAALRGWLAQARPDVERAMPRLSRELLKAA